MNFKNTIVDNFEAAFRGLRNPLESWAKSDSKFGIADKYDDSDFEVAALYCERDKIPIDNGEEYILKQDEYSVWLRENGILYWNDINDNVFKFGNLFKYAYIGPNDLDLAHRMVRANASERKFLRQIN